LLGAKTWEFTETSGHITISESDLLLENGNQSLEHFRWERNSHKERV